VALQRVLMDVSLLVISATFRRTDTQEDTQQTTEQAAQEECGPHEAQCVSLEALISGSEPREDKAEGGGPQTDVEQRVGSLDHTPGVVPAAEMASSER
jgi:hypothetical protein